MAGSANIFLDEGATGRNVTAQDGESGHATNVLTFSPDRGTAVRILNNVAAGASVGLPLYMKLLDSAGNDLPTNTTVYLAVRRAGQSAFHRISEEITSIGHYIRTDLTKQQDADNVDASKIELHYPEASGKEGRPSSVTIRHIDEFALVVESAGVFDASKSFAQIDTDALEGPFQY